MKTYFTNCKTLDNLKHEYRRLVMQHHPDRGGDTATMQAINAEYEKLHEQLKNSWNASHSADQQCTESPAEFRDICEALLKLDGLEIELCGSWLWIGGDTYNHKDALKAAGCRWCNTKKMWSWHHAEPGAKFSRGKRTMQEIRGKYGSQRIGSAGESAALTAAV